VLVNSKDAIVHEIQKLSKGGAGVSVKALKESWKGSAEAIKELEEEGLILVMRAGKNDEKNAKFVFWNTQSREAAEEMKIDEGIDNPSSIWYSSPD
jgi:transcription initiation factor TFIIE subunit beta